MEGGGLRLQRRRTNVCRSETRRLPADVEVDDGEPVGRREVGEERGDGELERRGGRVQRRVGSREDIQEQETAHGETGRVPRRSPAVVEEPERRELAAGDATRRGEADVFRSRLQLHQVPLPAGESRPGSRQADFRDYRVRQGAVGMEQEVMSSRFVVRLNV